MSFVVSGIPPRDVQRKAQGMDQKTVAFARGWARRYVRTKHPHGLDMEDVENRILESLYKYGRGKFPD